MHMLKVYFTVDVEIWCGGWGDIDNKFSHSFQSYIYGQTKKKDYGLPYKLKVLNDYGLTGVFFVEPLFSLRFGSAPLKEITGLITEANQQVELHLHTEWADEAKILPLPHITEKRQHLRSFTVDEQKTLIGVGKNLLSEAGVNQINAFRAGSFGFNIETLAALRENGIFVDCSYNATLMGLNSGLMPNQVLTKPLIHDGVYEVPMTVFFDRPGHLRHTQLCACSYRELEGLLWKALEEGRQEFVILSHSFELLDESHTRPNPVIIKRFQKICEFLDKNRDCFSTEGFANFSCGNSPEQPPPLTSPAWKTGLRVMENVWGTYA